MIESFNQRIVDYLLLPAVRRPLLLLVRCRRRGIALPLVLPPLLLLLSARGHVDEECRRVGEEQRRGVGKGHTIEAQRVG